MFRKSCLLLVLATCFFACKKDRKPPAPPVPDVTKLSGTWLGKYGISHVNAPGDTVLDEFTLPYTIVFRENGTMTVYDGLEGAILMAEGAYSLKGGKLFGEYKYIRGSSSNFSLEAILHKPDSLSGTWRIGSWGRTGGKIFLKK